MNARSRVRGRLLLTLRLGEMPEDMPSWAAARYRGEPPAERIDGGPIDRLLRHHGGTVRCARLHTSRVSREDRPHIKGARRFDDIEQLSGVARVLRVQVAEDGGIPALLHALAQVTTVESVRADSLCRTPFDAVAPIAVQRAAAVDAYAAWRSREQIRLPEAIGYEGGDGVVMLGLADTGVKADHADLSKLRRGFDAVDIDAATAEGLELVGDNALADEDPFDEVGHGTACAGILRANGNVLPPGAAGQCVTVPVRVLGAALSGTKRVGVGALANIDAGMKRLIDLGAKVINMSFGTAESVLGPDDPKPHEEVVRYALARGVLLVAASGNSGIEERYYPAAHEGVIAVGSVDGEGNLSRFSTRGGHVLVCAPGQDIWTCGLEGYQKVSGTSFASPFVAAVCALMVARAERRAWPLGPALARQILTDTARPFRGADVQGGGHGVVDALAALQRLDERIDDALENAH